jgi:hypothetical protein
MNPFNPSQGQLPDDYQLNLSYQQQQQLNPSLLSYQHQDPLKIPNQNFHPPSPFGNTQVPQFLQAQQGIAQQQYMASQPVQIIPTNQNNVLVYNNNLYAANAGGYLSDQLLATAPNQQIPNYGVAM